MAVREGKQNNTDLSGDSDRKDMVLHVYEISSGSTQNVGHVPYRPQVRLKISPTAVLFTVSEGKGRLGDTRSGDGRDERRGRQRYSSPEALSGGHRHRHNPEERPGHSVGMAAFIGNVSPSGSRAGATSTATETSRDKVIHVVDLTTGVVTNLGAQGDRPAVSGNTVVFRSIENAAGKSDLATETATAATATSRLRRRRRLVDQPRQRQAFPPPQLVREDQRHPDRFSISRERRAAKTDLNNDGDIRDNVVQVYDIATKTLTNSGLQARTT